MLRWVSNKSSRLKRKKRNHRGRGGQGVLSMEGAWRWALNMGQDLCQRRGGSWLSVTAWNSTSLAMELSQVWLQPESIAWLPQVYQEPEPAKTKVNHSNVAGIAHWRRPQMWSHAFPEGIAIIINPFLVLLNVTPSKFSGSSSGQMVLTEASTL